MSRPDDVITSIGKQMTIDVNGCPRCGINHDDVVFYKLTKPIEDSDGTQWTYFALCPSKTEPILLKIIDVELT